MYPNREAAACPVNRAQFKAQRGVGGVLRTMMYSKADHRVLGFGVALLSVSLPLTAHMRTQIRTQNNN